MTPKPASATPMRTYSTREFAHLVKTDEWRLNDLLRRYKLAEPPMIGRRRVWTDADVARTTKALADNGGA